MKLSILLRPALGMTLLLLSLAACNRQKNATPEASADDTNFTTEHARLEQHFNDVENISDAAASGNDLAALRTTSGSPLSTCATVSMDTLSNPRVLTVDYGNTNCLCNDGKYRRGKILVTYGGRYKDSGYAHVISFNNFFVNDNEMIGTKTVTNMGKNSQGQVYYNVSINGGVNLASGNGTLSWISNRVRTWVTGYSSPDLMDDAYQLTGSATITRANGRVINANITSPLQIARVCQWIKAGKVEITPQSGVTRYVDFGNGSCDDQATVTVNGNAFQVTLP